MSALSPTDKQVQRNLAHNVLVNIGDAASWLFGMSFVSTSTILPVFLSHLTDSSLLIGLIPALESLGWYLPQIFVAPLMQGRVRVKRPFMLATTLERLPFLLIGVAIFFFPASSVNGSSWPLTVFFLLLAFRMFLSGITGIPWQELIARVIPTRVRGRFFAAQRVAGGISGLLGAAGAAWMLGQFSYPLNFALCFLCMSIAAVVSWLFIAQTREPDVKPGKPIPYSNYWRELPALIREDVNFARYLLARSIGFLGQMATAFFAVHAVQTFGLGDSQAAVFNAVLLGTSIVASGVWGWIGDKWGQKLVLTASSSFYGLALLLAIVSDSVPAYYVIFFLVGVANSGWLLSDLALVMEFSTPQNRPTFMGLARGLLGPWVGLAPLIGGLLIGQFGYGAMITISAVLTAGGLVLTMTRVREPRWQKAPVAVARAE